MSTAFEVASIFRIKDEATATLRILSREVGKFDALVRGTKANLVDLGRVSFAGLNKNIRTITASATEMRAALGSATGIGANITTMAGEVRVLEAAAAGAGTSLSAMSRVRFAGLQNRLKALTDQAEKLSTTFGTTVTAMDTGIALVTDETRLLALQWRTVAAEVAAAATAMRGLKVRGVAGGGIYPRAGRAAAAGGRTHIHGGMSLPMPFGHAGAYTGGLTPGTIAAGGATLGVFETVKQAIEPEHQTAALMMMGLKKDEVLKMQEQAWKTAKAVPGTTFSEALKVQGEMYSIVGLEGALKLSPKMAILNRVLASTGKGKEDFGFTLTRATELMGQLTDPETHQVDLEKFVGFMDIATKIAIASHGKITPKDWLGFAKQSGPAAAGLTEQGFLTEAAIMQAMGGLRAGTAATAIQRLFSGGVMPQRIMKELIGLGIAKQDDFEVGRGGQVITKRGAMQDVVKEFQADPRAAILDIIVPALEKAGITDMAKQAQEIYRIFPTATAQREAYELLRGRVQIGQERERLEKGLVGDEALAILQTNDPTQVMASFAASLKNLLGAVGSPMMESAIPVMNKMATAMNAMGEAASVALGKPGEPKNVPQSILSGLLSGTTIGGAVGALIGGTIGFLAHTGALRGGMLGFKYGTMIGGAIGAGIGAEEGIKSVETQTIKGDHRWDSYEPKILRAPDNLLKLFNHFTKPAGAAELEVPFADRWSEVPDAWAKAPINNAAEQRWNVVPPPSQPAPEQAPQIVHLTANLIIDGRKFGELAVKYMTRESSGPAQGAPYHDATYSTTPLDYALI